MGTTPVVLVLDQELANGHAGGLGAGGPDHDDDHELVAGHAGGLRTGGPGHGDDHVLAVHDGKGGVGWCRKAIVGAITRYIGAIWR